jgi:hypothetical protein
MRVIEEVIRGTYFCFNVIICKFLGRCHDILTKI